MMAERPEGTSGINSEEEAVPGLSVIKWTIAGSICIAIGILFLQWKIVLLAIVGLGLVIAIFLNPFVGIILFLVGAYMHPVGLLGIPTVYRPTTLAAIGVTMALGFHAIVYKDIKAIKTPPLFFMLGFSFIVLCSTLANLRSFNAFIDFIKLLILYFLVVYLVKSRRQLLITIWCMLFLGSITAIYALYQSRTGAGHIGQEGYVYASAFSPAHGMFAAQLVPLIPLTIGLSLAQRRRWVKSGLFAILVATISAVVISFSRSGMLGLAAVLLVSIWIFYVKRRRIMPLIAIGLLFLTLLPLVPSKYWQRAETITNLEEQSIRGRLVSNLIGLQIMLDYPFLGVGLRRFGQEYSPRALLALGVLGRKDYVPHNIIIEVGSQFGLVALLFYILLLVWAFRDLAATALIFAARADPLLAIVCQSFRIGLIGYLVMGMFTPSLFQKFFWIIIGLTVALKEMALVQEPKSQPTISTANSTRRMGAI